MCCLLDAHSGNAAGLRAHLLLGGEHLFALDCARCIDEASLTTNHAVLSLSMPHVNDSRRSHGKVAFTSKDLHLWLLLLLLKSSSAVANAILGRGISKTAFCLALLLLLLLLLLQIIIDIAKHAVLGKFNDIRPGIYREYMRDLCGDSMDHHSHNMHKLVRSVTFIDWHLLVCIGSSVLAVAAVVCTASCTPVW
jgi:hypothetical protein